MRVRQLQLENFRAFRKAEMRLPGTGLVLVAGPNNVGKTALLSALDALAGDHGDLASLRYGGSEEPARLSATFELDQAERAAILENAAGGQWLLDAGVLSSLQVLFEQWQDQSLVLREVLGNWPDAGLQPVARMRREPGQAGHPYGYEVIRAFQKGNGQEDHQGGVLAPLDQAHRLLEVTGTFSEGQAGLDGYLSGQSNLAPIMAPPEHSAPREPAVPKSLTRQAAVSPASCTTCSPTTLNSSSRWAPSSPRSCRTSGSCGC
jgi:hypothetical protein